MQARVHLGALTPTDVQVELYVGRLNADGEIIEAQATALKLVGPDRDSYLFEAGAVPCRMSGQHGFTVRGLPHHPDLTTPFQPGLIVWASDDLKEGTIT